MKNRIVRGIDEERIEDFELLMSILSRFVQTRICDCRIGMEDKLCNEGNEGYFYAQKEAFGEVEEKLKYLQSLWDDGQWHKAKALINEPYYQV